MDATDRSNKKVSFQDIMETCKKRNTQQRVIAISLVTISVTSFCLYCLSGISHYNNYNSSLAYEPFDLQNWTDWLVVVCGGIRSHDLFVPLTLVVGYLLISVTKQNDFADFASQSQFAGKTTSTTVEGELKGCLSKLTTVLAWGFFLLSLFGSWDIGSSNKDNDAEIVSPSIIFLPIVLAIVIIDIMNKKITGRRFFCKSTNTHRLSVIFILLFLPLRMVYIPLYFVNFITAGEKESTELRIIGSEVATNTVRGYSFYTYFLIVIVDKDIPYLIKVSESDYDSYQCGKTYRVAADVKKGCMDYSIVTDYSIIETNIERDIVGSWVRTSDIKDKNPSIQTFYANGTWRDGRKRDTIYTGHWNYEDNNQIKVLRTKIKVKGTVKLDMAIHILKINSFTGDNMVVDINKWASPGEKDISYKRVRGKNNNI